MKLGIAEIMIKASEAPSHAQRLEVLRSNDGPALRTAFRLAYDFDWDLPRGWKPEYRPSVYLDQEGVLYQALRHINKFSVDGYPGLSQERKKVLFIQLLESVTPDDARLLLGAVAGRIPWKGLSKRVISEALPGLFPVEEPV